MIGWKKTCFKTFKGPQEIQLNQSFVSHMHIHNWKLAWILKIMLWEDSFPVNLEDFCFFFGGGVAGTCLSFMSGTWKNLPKVGPKSQARLKDYLDTWRSRCPHGWVGKKNAQPFSQELIYINIYIYTYIFRSCCTFLPSMWIFWPVCNWSTVIDVGKVLQSWGNPSNINWLIHRQVLREWKNSSGSSRCTRYIEGFNCRMMCPICIAHSYSMIFLLAWSFGLIKPPIEAPTNSSLTYHCPQNDDWHH